MGWSAMSEASEFIWVAARDAVARSPIQTPVNPLGPRALGPAREWAVSSGLVSSGPALARLNDTRYGEHAADTCPTASIDGLVLLTKWMMWFFIIDDHLDEAASVSDIEGVRHAFVDACSDHPADTSIPAVAALNDLWSSTAAGRTRPWRDRARANLGRWFDTWTVEQEWRSAGLVPTMDQYLRHRRISGAMDLCGDLVEAVIDMEISDDARALASYIGYRDAVAMVPGIINDVASYPREHASGHLANLVTVLRASGSSEHEAVRRACDTFLLWVHRYQTVEQGWTAELKQLSNSSAAAAIRWTDEMRGWVGGYPRWLVKYADVGRHRADVDTAHIEDILTSRPID